MSTSYTINYFIKEISKLKYDHVTTYDKELTAKVSKSVDSFLNKHDCLYSRKIEELNHLLHGKLFAIHEGVGHFKEFGKNPKTRILRALKLRKNKELRLYC